MESTTDICPITGWSMNPVLESEAVVLQLKYITDPGQANAKVSESCLHSLTRDQALALSWQIFRTAQLLERST